MAIILDETTSVIIQGVTGRFGEYYTKRMIDYGTNVVGGVTPTKGGEWFESRPVFDSVLRAVDATGANTSMIAVPPMFSVDAIYEAIKGGIKTIICITENIPIKDMIPAVHYAKAQGVTLLGPSSAGVLIPDTILVGTIPATAGLVGNIGVVSKSGSLLYDVGTILSKVRLGQTALVSVGTDAITGLSLRDVLEIFENDPNTERIVLLGEVGGTDELDAADYIRDEMTKPIIAMVVGQGLPIHRVFGHSGAIVQGVNTSAEEKIEYLQAAGARIATHPEDIPRLLLNLD